MTRFLDGPAKGQGLSLKGSPVFLRVVLGLDGKWDALDQLDDTPRPDERIHVYRLEGTAGGAFVDGRDPKTGRRFGGFMAIAEYRYWPEQPADSQMRTTEAWRAWCADQKAKSEGRAP